MSLRLPVRRVLLLDAKKRLVAKTTSSSLDWLTQIASFFGFWVLDVLLTSDSVLLCWALARRSEGASGICSRLETQLGRSTRGLDGCSSSIVHRS